MIRRLQVLHKLGYIHRDLKPANITVGHGKKANIIYLIDFGLTKKQQEDISMNGFNPNQGHNNKMAGTPIYAPINAHHGNGTCFKKDDVQSLMYVLIYLCRGFLPWQNIKCNP